MKKLIYTLLAVCTLLFVLASCGMVPEKEDKIEVIDGYLVVNGVKTEYKAETEDDVTEDTNKTEITVENGYLVVNGEKTEHEVKTEPVISVIDGYVAINGVKTEHYVAYDCQHIWKTVTTAPTCSNVGYDTMTCSLCDKSVKINETEKLDHNFSTEYIMNDNYHWYKCTACSEEKDKAMHVPNDDGECETCGIPLSDTPGVIYDMSADGSYALVVGYTGAANKVKIASEYNGVPVKSIYDNVFKSNVNITSVVIPDSVTSIGDEAFYNCTSLSSVVIGDNVTSIGRSAFHHCTRLGSVVIGDNVTSIGYYAFEGCRSSLYTEYEFGKYVRSGDNPYAVLIEITNKNMSTYTINENTKHISYGAFKNCSRLTSITIPDSVTSIGDYAFCECISLSSVEIPDSVTSIGDGAFSNCTKLRNVYYTGSKEEWAAISIGSSNYYLTSATIHYNYIPE